MENEIKDAIAHTKVIEFDYHGFHRIVEPHILGINGGIKQLLGYQVRGQSRSGGLPEWRRFDLHEMTHVSVLNEKFPGRPTPTGKHSTWDHQIAIVA